MKRSKLSYKEWKCILSKKQRIHNFNNEILNGFVSLLEIKEVTEPQVWNFNGEDIVVCIEGYKWLTILPQEENYCITAMISEKNEIILWYIDIIAEQGLDLDGIPYFDDLYLDLVVYPDGTIMEDDREELEHAWEVKEISTEQLNQANRVCDELKRKLQDMDWVMEYTYKCLELLN
ncbi:DUF402 domain-containing protein [Anaerosporobacter sp.]|uniref:DUF402 domain-containing protein n=1 Tax=Anaerosporobacter sp. TaxID=1872529 RepID=UPI00286F5287|nr:DUF402 domain-containing protein [Anaerosporobacter sp.]